MSSLFKLFIRLSLFRQTSDKASSFEKCTFEHNHYNTLPSSTLDDRMQLKDWQKCYPSSFSRKLLHASHSLCSYRLHTFWMISLYVSARLSERHHVHWVWIWIELERTNIIIILSSIDNDNRCCATSPLDLEFSSLFIILFTVTLTSGDD